MRLSVGLLSGSLSMLTAFAGSAVFADVAVAAPTTRYVATNGDDGGTPFNDCLSKAAPCKTIQYAIDDAAAGDTVSIAAGVYAQSTVINKSITLTGPTIGTATLTGDPAVTQLPTVFVYDIGAAVDATVSRLTVSSATSAGIGGEGVVRLTVADSTVTKSALAGVAVNGDSLTIVRSTISDNVGTGVLGLEAPVTVTDSTVTGTVIGTVENGPAIFNTGFGIASVRAPVRLVRSTVRGSETGGVLVSAGDTATDRSSVSDSVVSGNGEVGVANQGGLLDVDTSTVSGNGGTGVANIGGAVDIRDSTIALTTATTGTGRPTDAGLTYASAQQAPDLAVGRVVAAFSRTSKVKIGTRTLTVRPQAQRKLAAAPGFTVSGTALVQAPGVTDCVGSNVVDAGYNSSADATNSCGFSAAKNDLVKTDPELGPLADNGGPTQTHLPAASSPLRDRVPAAQSGATDQRGVTRPQGPRSDIGAVELAAVPVAITTTSLPDGQVGEAYRKTLAAIGGDGSYAWSPAPGSSLPKGLHLSTAGVVSGTPATAGTSTFTVLADGASKRFTLKIAAAEAAPNGNGADPIAETGAPSASLMAWGAALVLSGFAVMLAAGRLGRRRGRHRPARSVT